ncbi:uncharacterized protein LOC112462372 [Temnothorax curvispinosus]|uniref:Uncharacterized protein LOC112462372 n=1 Tax=Temnothorax curvispinosus TaxID=300111 RepID=A0A6J1QN52_9HYME|nr:uncharacterized protein LOC112462372 [Temnothorax curvispinosus]
MPSCFVKNCKNRTNVLFIKNVKFYSVPKDPELRIKWLEACQRDKDCMMKCERVCEVHFLSNCFEEQMTKRKLKRKLKAGSIPTELLQLPKERQKRIHTNNTNNAGPEKSVRTAIPTYAELVECATKETENESIPENTTFKKLWKMYQWKILILHTMYKMLQRKESQRKCFQSVLKH